MNLRQPALVHGAQEGNNETLFSAQDRLVPRSHADSLAQVDSTCSPSASSLSLSSEDSSSSALLPSPNSSVSIAGRRCTERSCTALPAGNETVPISERDNRVTGRMRRGVQIHINARLVLYSAAAENRRCIHLLRSQQWSFLARSYERKFQGKHLCRSSAQWTSTT